MVRRPDNFCDISVLLKSLRYWKDCHQSEKLWRCVRLIDSFRFDSIHQQQQKKMRCDANAKKSKIKHKVPLGVNQVAKTKLTVAKILYIYSTYIYIYLFIQVVMW